MCSSWVGHEGVVAISECVVKEGGEVGEGPGGPLGEGVVGHGAGFGVAGGCAVVGGGVAWDGGEGVDGAVGVLEGAAEGGLGGVGECVAVGASEIVEVAVDGGGVVVDGEVFGAEHDAPADPGDGHGAEEDGGEDGEAGEA